MTNLLPLPRTMYTDSSLQLELEDEIQIELKSNFKKKIETKYFAFEHIEVLNDLSIRHLIKLILYKNDVKILKFKRNPV